MDKMINSMTSRILEEVAPHGYKYRKGETDFFQKSKRKSFSLFFDVFPDSKRKHFALEVICRFRIDDIENVYSKHHPHIDAAEQKKHFTICARYGNKPLFANSLSAPFLPTDALAKADEFLKDFQQEMKPFMDRYSERSELVTNLSEDDYKVWITSDQISRFSILLSDAAIEGDRERFDTYREQLLQHCNDPFALAKQPVANAIIDGIERNFY